MFLPRRILEEKLRNMLAEDVGEGDLTTALTVPAGAKAEAEVRCKDSGVVAGIEEATTLLQSLGLTVEAQLGDGDEVQDGRMVMKISGDARTILSAERTVLNLISRMSGIATATRRLVIEVERANLEVKVACTRKIAPGLLYFDKKAVFIGGGDTHRLHLDDMILIKDNHVAVAGSLQEAVQRARRSSSFSKKIEVEVASVAEALEAAELGADIVMLDNFSPEQVAKAVAAYKRKKIYGKVLLEASGGITRENVVRFASKGVDIVSLGEITSGSRALDFSLEVVRTKRK